jgi:hypothetical protein
MFCPNFFKIRALIKFNKIKIIKPVKTHVDIAHHRLFVLRKT